MVSTIEQLRRAELDQLSGRDPASVGAALSRIGGALGTYSSSSIPATDLRQEFDALVLLYRAVRQADAFMQQERRSSEIAEDLVRVYYALRTTQASLTMRYALEGRGVEAPEMSPVGTAIGLFDAPKVLAQQTHLESGSYDVDLPRFVWWMREIWTDMLVRRADYLRFYGEADLEAAITAIRELLDLGPDGEAVLRDFAPSSAHDPTALLDRLRRWAGEGSDLVDAARAIQEVGAAARYALLSVLAHNAAYQAQLGRERVARIEADLEAAIHWRFPVGETALFDLAAEQEAFDELLGRVPSGASAALPASEGWVEAAEHALRRACHVEQSLRDHQDEYRARYSDARSRRSFRWYVWEFLSLLDRGARDPLLGARPRS